MSNMTTEKKDLKQLTDSDHSFTFNSKVSNTGDDYLFNKDLIEKKKGTWEYCWYKEK